MIRMPCIKCGKKEYKKTAIDEEGFVNYKCIACGTINLRISDNGSSYDIQMPKEN
jgi:hypothetical protein